MFLSRRSTLLLAGQTAVAGISGALAPRSARAQQSPQAPVPAAASAEDEHRAPRTLGDPAAKVTVMEFFSLTCTHCAAFARDTMPQIEKELVTPGQVRFVYRDYPLDQVALTAAMVARYLPAERYVRFVNALFANQDRWAFARGVNSTEEIWKMAALAGMDRPAGLDPAATAGRSGSLEDRRDSELRHQWAEILRRDDLRRLSEARLLGVATAAL